ncbi:CHAT domain-containing protein, partial [Vararia minispora EC-137]
DLEHAIDATSRAISLTPDGHPDLPMRLSNLGSLLSSRFELLGELEDLKHGIDTVRFAVSLTPDGHPDMPMRLGNLGNFFWSRFWRLGGLEDLEHAIDTMGRAVSLVPDGHPHMPMILNNLGIFFRSRFERLGKLEDLEHGIDATSRAISLTPDGHTDMPVGLGNLGSLFLTRFNRLGELKDLEHAIDTTSRAISLTPDGHPHMPKILGNLGILLELRFQCLGKPEDIEHAIDATRRAISLTPDGHTDMPGWLNNLGSLFTDSSRFNRLCELEDLEYAIDTISRAVSLIPDGHPDMPSLLNNLGVLFSSRFRRLRKLEDLEHAIDTTSRAISLTPNDHPYLSEGLINLGDYYMMRCRHLEEVDGVQYGADVYSLAVDQPFGPPSVRLQAARAYARLTWPFLIYGYISLDRLLAVCGKAFQLIPQVAWLGNSVTRRYEQLAEFGEITSSAVFAAVFAGDLPRAVEWLDQGRGVVWGQLLQLRSPISDLHRHHPGFAKELQSISNALENSGNSAGSALTNLVDSATRSSPLDTHVGDESSARIRLARRYEGLLTQIRTLNGFESFLKPKTFSELCSACADGPIILINVFERVPFSVGAFVVLRSPDLVVPVLLPELSYERAEQMRSLLLESLQQINVRQRKTAERGVSMESTYRSRFIDVLGSLWSIIVSPILQAIELQPSNSSSEALPHVTWCATGPLSFLPIHAAGLYDSPNPRDRIFNRVVSSYTPTMSSLIRPYTEKRLTSSVSSPSKRVLVVSQPNTPNCGALPSTFQEAANVKKQFPDNEITHLDHTHATVGAVLREMRTHHFPFIHLACHGMQDPEDPRKSAFILYDGKLHLSDIMSHSAEGAELAFLSACHTAKGDAKLPEESVHLAAGMLTAGYKAVIGTMWSIIDEDAPVVADGVYRRLVGDQGGSTGRVAYALHEAVKELREKVGEEDFMRWAPFVHFGS